MGTHKTKLVRLKKQNRHVLSDTAMFYTGVGFNADEHHSANGIGLGQEAATPIQRKFLCSTWLFGIRQGWGAGSCPNHMPKS